MLITGVFGGCHQLDMDIDPNKIADMLMSLSANQRKLVFKMIIDKMLTLSDKNNNSDIGDYGLIDFTRYGLPKRCFWAEKICLESYEKSTSSPADHYLPSSSTPIGRSPPTPIVHSPLTTIGHISPTSINQSPYFTPESQDMDPLLEQEVKIHSIILPENVLGIPASKAAEKLGHLDRELVYNLAANDNVHTFSNSDIDLYELMRIYLFDTGDTGLIFPPPMIPLNNCSLGEENFPPL
ncbi:uncharacterized protein LOC141854506 [Brevipalpus obovatus]|uniref:uncharacterized protein LOC141854506 n=1 Tax=Brevipalpus obovatus TaxID=246614 RepID=UPI003D9E26E3